MTPLEAELLNLVAKLQKELAEAKANQLTAEETFGVIKISFKEKVIYKAKI